MKLRIARIWFCLTVYLLSPFAPAALSHDLLARITSPRPNRYFSEGGSIPLTLEFDCCIAQNGAPVYGNFFYVEVERLTWDNIYNGRRWMPHLDLFSVDMTSCAGPLAPCQGSRIIDLTHGLSMDPTNAPPADAIAYRVRARGCPVDPSNGVNLLGPWSDWVTFHVGKHPLAGVLKTPVSEVMADLHSDDPVEFDPAPPGEGETAPPAPDLTVKFYALESQNPAYVNRYILIFHVKNQGTAYSPPTKLAIACEKVEGGSCPNWFPSLIDVHTLGPGGTFSTDWTEQNLALLPPPGVRFKLTGTVDPDNLVNEGAGEGNNQVVAYFPATMIHDALHAGGMAHEIVSGQGQMGVLQQRPELKGQFKALTGQEAGESQAGTVAVQAAGRKLSEKAADGRALKGRLKETGPAAGMVKLQVQRMWTVPAAPKAGEIFDLHLAVGNAGSAAGGMGESMQLNCTALEGGPCPALGAAPRLSQALAAKGAQTLKLENLRWEAGCYRLTANPASAPKEKMTLLLTVVPSRRLASPGATAVQNQTGQAGAAISNTGAAAAAGAKRAMRRE